MVPVRSEDVSDSESISPTYSKASPTAKKGRLFKFAAKHVMVSNKRRLKSKETVSSYCKTYRDYVLDLMEVLLNKEEMQDCKKHIWYNFLLSTLPGLVGAVDSTLYPEIPVDAKLADKWNVFTLLSFLKYSRPDFMEYAMEVIYPEIKSLKYY